ncbi:hypothetical protein ACLKA6_006012 [Drosophila palustris]
MPQVIVTAPGSQPPETRTGSRFLRGNGTIPPLRRTRVAPRPISHDSRENVRRGAKIVYKASKLFWRQELDRAYENLLPENQLYIRRHNTPGTIGRNLATDL